MFVYLLTAGVACKDAYELPRDSESSEDNKEEEKKESDKEEEAVEEEKALSPAPNEDDLVCEAPVQVVTLQSVEETNEDDLVFEAPVNVQVVTQSVEETPQLDPLTHPEDVVKIEAKKKAVIEVEFEVID